MTSLLNSPVTVYRVGPNMFPDKDRVFLRRYYPSTDSIARRIISNVSTMPDSMAKKQLAEVLRVYGGRHRRDLKRAFRSRFHEVAKYLNGGWSFPEEREILLGTYFMHEYSIETCALFNPSAVPHWDQSGLPKGSQRFVLSLRSCGEGHISSITFRTGVIDCEGRVLLDPCSKYVTEPFPVGDSKVNYAFPDDAVDISERCVFPVAYHQRNGLEDARFVRFVEEDGGVRYYGTYTAYDGRNIKPEMISTTDFKSFRFESLEGDIDNKGMALFPRRVNGKYMMLSRQDDESILLMTSDSLNKWKNPVVIAKPEQPWEQFKMGNCGSPIETEKGWLVLTHGVGSLRQYGIGLILLDLNDPSRVIGRLREPILIPNECEREGYVPNVVYTCGGMLHGNLLMLPYAASDSYSTFAVLRMSDIFKALCV